MKKSCVEKHLICVYVKNAEDNIVRITLNGDNVLPFHIRTNYWITCYIALRDRNQPN